MSRFAKTEDVTDGEVTVAERIRELMWPLDVPPLVWILVAVIVALNVFAWVMIIRDRRKNDT